MTCHQIIQESIEISCDYPGCDECLFFGDEGWEKIKKMIRAIGWIDISFPGEEDKEYLDYCPNCKEKETPINEPHVCIYMRKTKKGKPSEYGSVLECVFCEKLK